jgi:beta-N-acetylhexosaminidase
LIVGFEGTELTARLRSLLRRLQPAGVILFARNITSAEQTWRLLRECQKCASAPLFTCVDLEGGTVDRFRDALGPAPSAAEVFATGDRKLFRKHGQIIGANCRSLGFNVDFAPALDLAFEASRSVMGSRAVSADPRRVIAYAREFLAGLESAKVLGCGKHFPGLGEGKLDSHHELPVIEKTLKKLWGEDLLPYRTLRRQLPMVMVSHAAYPQVTKTKIPASLSKLWITDILRKRIGYKNLIVSDDLEMGGALSAAPVGEAAVEFVRAGGDLCLVCHREDYVLQAHEALVKAAEHDRKFVRRVEESARRVAAFKKKWARMLRPGKEPSPAMIEKLSRRLWEFGEQARIEALNRAEQGRRV